MYKYCIVPKCTNTTFTTPGKLFFNVPKDLKLRQKWYSAVKRDDKTPPSTKSTRHCCEDHFDLEEDMENYVKFKLVGGKLNLKKAVLPHKLECQKTQKNIIDRPGFKKKQAEEYFEKVLSKDIGHEDLLLHPIEEVECENQDSNIIQNSDPLNMPEEIDVLLKNNERGKKTRAVQFNMKPKMKPKSNNTPIKWKQHIVKKNSTEPERVIYKNRGLHLAVGDNEVRCSMNLTLAGQKCDGGLMHGNSSIYVQYTNLGFNSFHIDQSFRKAEI